MARPASVYPTFENQSQLDRDQANVVNNCWSEGSYELGVETLDAFRTVDKRYPPPSHIRQLLALALYPPEPVPVSVTQPRPHLPPKRPTTPTEPAPPRSRPHTQSTQTALPASGPAPLSPRKLQEQTEIPSGRASQLAQELLTTLCNTTRPAFLVAGLTSYARPACDADLFDAMVRTGKVDESRSPLVREAVAVGRARDCWTMLRPGFLSRKSAISSRAMDTDEYDDTEGEEEEIVASHAWGVLEWWMRLFEVDQAEHEQEQSSVAPSALFLSHIPPGAPQWDIHGALGVALAAYRRPLSLSQAGHDQAESQRDVSTAHGIGFRILSLLINATRTCAVAPSVLLDQLCTHMQAGVGVPSSVFKRILADFTEPADPGSGLGSRPADYSRVELELPGQKRRLYARFCFCLAALYLARTGEGVSDVGVFGGGADSSARRPKARPMVRGAGDKPAPVELMGSQSKPLDPYPAPTLLTIVTLLKSTSSISEVSTMTKHALARLAIAESLDVEMQYHDHDMAGVGEPWISEKDAPEWRARIAEAFTAGFAADINAGVEGLDSSSLWKKTRVRCQMW